MHDCHENYADNRTDDNFAFRGPCAGLRSRYGYTDAFGKFSTAGESRYTDDWLGGFT